MAGAGAAPTAPVDQAPQCSLPRGVLARMAASRPRRPQCGCGASALWLLCVARSALSVALACQARLLRAVAGWHAVASRAVRRAAAPRPGGHAAAEAEGDHHQALRRGSVPMVLTCASLFGPNCERDISHGLLARVAVARCHRRRVRALGGAGFVVRRVDGGEVGGLVRLDHRPVARACGASAGAAACVFSRHS